MVLVIMVEVRVPDGAGHFLRFLEVDGFLYPNFPVDSIRGLPDLEIRSDDVIVCAYPKSGTHWLWEMVRQLLTVGTTGSTDGGTGSLLAEDGGVQLPSLPVTEKDNGMLELVTQAHLRALPSPRALNTHVYFQHLPRQVFTTKCRIMTLVRDPRDVVVSYYHHHSKLTSLYEYEGEWENYLPLFLDGKLDYGCWFEYHASWTRGLKQHPDIPLLSLTFEYLKQNSLGALRKMADFLNINCSDDVLRAIDIKCSFDNMREVKGHIEVDKTGQPIMYRKGKVGDWRTWFNAQQLASFTQVYNAKISDLQLEDTQVAIYGHDINNENRATKSSSQS